MYPLVFTAITSYNYFTSQNYIFESLFTNGLSNDLQTFVIILTGAMATLGCLFYTIGTMYVENAIWVPIVDNCEIPVLYLMEKYILNYDSTNWLTYLGSTLILIVVLYLAIEKYVTNNNKFKKITGFYVLYRKLKGTKL